MNTTTRDGKVTVFFESKNWSCGAASVWMALVPEAQTSYTGEEVYGVKSDNGPVVTGSDEQHDVDISAGKLAADTTYTVWVKVGDKGAWMRSNTTYTHPAASE